MSKSYLKLILSGFLFINFLNSLQASDVQPSSALEFQQTTDTRIAVEATHLRFFTGNTERMTIDASGKVGIGTTTPVNGVLHIYKTGGMGGWNNIPDPTKAALRIERPNADLYVCGNGIFTAGKVMFMGTLTEHDLSFGTNTLERLRIESNGNVGIGTDAPAYKLHVSGIVRATSFISNTQTYADFVFEDDYQLPTLTEVEHFIEKNNHLPDIPSEKEARVNGVDLQKMQAKLLQKIEELTLYVIEQQKSIDALKHENASIKKVLNQ